MNRTNNSSVNDTWQTRASDQAVVMPFALPRTMSINDQESPIVNPTSTHTELHPGVIGIAIGGWVWMIFAFWLTFGGNLESGFTVAIDTFFAAMYFGVPALIVATRKSSEQRAKLSANSTRSKTFRSFLNGSLETVSGSVSGANALVQIAYLPLVLAAGATAMGFIFMFARNGQL